MKYGIIVCPNCKTAKIVDLSYKTSRCNSCNKLLKLAKLRVLYKSDSQQEIRSVIGEVNKKVSGHKHER